MPEIIILFVIVSIISSVFQALKSVQTARPVQSPISSSFDEEEDCQEEYSSIAATRDIVDNIEDAVEVVADPSPRIAEQGNQPSEKSMSFTRDSVLNGIIFSEILSPPKSRRSNHR